MIAVGYLRVSTVGQEADGMSLDAQKAAIGREVAHREWTLAGWASDTASAKNMRKRPGLIRVLEELDAGQYGALVVSRLDRLSRSVGDFAQILDRADRGGWAVVCMDPAVDLTTPYGRAMASVAATFAQLERELIGQRTREGIAAKVAAGGTHGAKAILPDLVGAQAARGRSDGLTWAEIGRRLLLEGHRPPGGGGQWAPATLERARQRHTAAAR